MELIKIAMLVNTFPSQRIEVKNATNIQTEKTTEFTLTFDISTDLSSIIACMTPASPPSIGLNF